MATPLTIDIDVLPREREADMRARHASVEWGRASARPIRHEDYALDPDFEPYTPVFGRVDRFTDSYEDLPLHVTLLEDGVLFGTEFFVCDRLEPTGSDTRLYQTNMTKLAAAAASGERLDVPEGPLYLVGASAPHHAFYHWCFQCLPGIALLRDEARRRGRDYRIVLPPLDAMQQRSIELLAPYRDACLARASDDLPRRFYLSRRDAPRKRPLENSDALAAALQARGYPEVVMSTLSLEDQVALFARAESIVSPHGAGLVNLMFAPRTTRVLEIMPEHYRQACFFRLAQARGIGYAMVFADMAREHPDDPRHGSLLRVDIDSVLSTLERSEALARGSDHSWPDPAARRQVG